MSTPPTTQGLLLIDHVRKAMRPLEQLKLITSVWRGARTRVM